jgi:hypothetical protein
MAPRKRIRGAKIDSLQAPVSHGLSPVADVLTSGLDGRINEDRLVQRLLMSVSLSSAFMSGHGRTPYLFQCDGEEHFAVSPDKGGGANYSEQPLHAGQQEFQPEVQDAVPPAITSEPTIEGIDAEDYYIW